MRRLLGFEILIGLFAVGIGAVSAEERDVLKSRVPVGEIEQVRTLKNPFKPTPENVQRGKRIFEGKGTCFTCHGMNGTGDGPAAVGLDPSPRDFTNPDFQKNRTDGELMWVIKNGSPGTAMVPMVGSAITEEEGWLVLLYIRSLAKKK